ncbi:MAG: ATP-binding protein [Paenalcaligenes sp.]
MPLATQHLVLSMPYAVDMPAIYKRPKDTRSFADDLAGLRVAVVANYLDADALAAQYPKTEFVCYRYSSQAMAATAFGRTDLLLSDSLSARYLINQSYFNEIKVERLLPIASNGFAFALKADNQALLHIINTALIGIGKPTLDSLSRRWVGGGYDLPEDRLELTTDEQIWLGQHPVVRLAVNSDQAPVAFIDKDGNLSGMAADILDLVTQRTGLRFDYERVNDFASLVEAVKEGRADLSVISWTPEREAFLRFSPPIVVTPFALFVRNEDASTIGQLSDLEGKRLAIAKGHAYVKRIALNYPSITLIETATSLDALRAVAIGQADAATLGLISGRYYLSKFYEDLLTVSGVIEEGAALGGFAMRRQDVELQSILSKVIAAIPPEEMNVIAGRWRPNPAMRSETWWDYRRMVFGIMALAVVLVSIFTAWALYLRQQISKRMASERALNDQLEFVEALSEATPQPIYVRDREGRFVSGTHSYLDAVGASTEDLVGKTVLEGPSKFGAAAAMHDAYMQAMQTNTTIRVLRATKMNGEERWIDHWVKPFHDATGVIQGVVCGWLDVTEQQRLIFELERLISELEVARKLAVQSNWEKTNFLATMSHEIRTPLSAVIGTLELVQRQAERGILDKNGIQIAYDCANGLLHLMGDVLDIVRIEAGRLVLAPERVNLKDLLESVVLVFEGLALEKGLELLLELDTDTTKDVLIDPVRIKQVLFNLVSNAIKFTSKGYVKISAIGQSVEAGKVRVQLVVSDTGIGISAEDQERLFHPFAQVNQLSSEQTGVGLGLAITRSLCELMGGSLSMSSTPGEGTCVVIELLLNQMDTLAIESDHALLPSSAAVEQSAAQPLRVLVVDDYAVHRQLICLQLDFLGHTFSEAENGQAALQLWRSMPFDLVITDCRMPGMSGVELALAIRHDEETTGRTRCVIIGLTADAQREEIQRCLSAGMDECLVKPLGLDKLKTKLWQLSNGLAEKQTPILVFDAGSSDAAGASALLATDEKNTRESDFDTLLVLTGGDKGKARELAKAILKSLDDATLQLQQPATHYDRAAIGTLAHQVLGVARVLGNEALAKQCKQLEVLCQSDRSEQVGELADAITTLQLMLGDMHARYQRI